MEAKSSVVQMLNGLLTTELTAVNQYFLHSRMCASWGYGRMAQKLREASYEEMRDAERLMDRVLDLGGLPNLQRLGTFQAGETIAEQLRLSADLERGAVQQLKEGITLCEKELDLGTSSLLRPMVLEEERQLYWLEAQIALIDQLGEQQYLALQAGE
jgi:bacterioferritin